MHPDLKSYKDYKKGLEQEEEQNKEEKTIYNMELHEFMYVDKEEVEGAICSILRVNGGWIYRSFINAKNNDVFVPYSTEFLSDK